MSIKDHHRNHISIKLSGSISRHHEQAIGTQQLWQNFLSDPMQWWDNRSNQKAGQNLFAIEEGYERIPFWAEGWWILPGMQPKSSLQSISDLRSQHALNSGMKYAVAGQRCDRNVIKLCQEGRLKEAMQIMDLTVHLGFQVSIKAFLCLVQGCIRNKDLPEGKQVHSHIIQAGLGSNIILGNNLLNMYATCGSLLEARKLFEMMPEHDILSWAAIISAYTKHGEGAEALNLFQKMQDISVVPDKIVLIFVLKACSSLAALEQGKQAHAHAIRCGLHDDLFVGTTLVFMYSKCHCMHKARQVFNRLHARDVVAWSVMIAGYVQQGYDNEALMLFDQMQQDAIIPDRAIFLNIVKACTNLSVLDQGKQVHIQIINNGYGSDVLIAHNLVFMYSKCGSMQDAHRAFEQIPEKNLALWNALIAGYAKQASKEAITMFEHMQQEGMKPDGFSFSMVLKACTSLKALECGRQFHAHVIESGFESDIFVKNSLVVMYAKCGSMADALKVFDSMSEHDVVSWTTVIAGCAQQGQDGEALTLYEQMQQEGVKPNNVTFKIVLKACGDLAALDSGKQIHSQVVENGFDLDISVGNSLIGMYAKCGRMEDAYIVFDEMCDRDIVSWNTIISGYAQQGQGKEVLKLFEKMRHGDVKPDDITFLSVLSACSYTGLVDVGCWHFHSMNQDYGILATLEHYTSMVDLLGRAGELDEVIYFLNDMPVQPDFILWLALLGACKCYGNMEMGSLAFECIYTLEPGCSSAYVLQSNICAGVGRWDEAAKIK